MNSLNMARSAYGRQQAPVRSNRKTEYDLFTQMTRRLATANSKRSVDFPAFVAAVHDNIVMWRTLASDVADPDNALPQTLRAQLFYLYQFTVEHSRKVLADKAKIEVLIDINTAVMRGLRGEGEVP